MMTGTACARPAIAAKYPFCAQPESSAPVANARISGTFKSGHARAIPRGRIAHDTVNVATIPIEACGGPSVPPRSACPVCQHAFACWQTGTQSGGTDGPPHASIGMVPVHGDVSGSTRSSLQRVTRRHLVGVGVVVSCVARGLRAAGDLAAVPGRPQALRHHHGPRRARLHRRRGRPRLVHRPVSQA